MINALNDGGFVIASGGSWLPGVYADKRTANYAFRFPCQSLTAMQESVNPGGVITFKMLQSFKQHDRLVRVVT